MQILDKLKSNSSMIVNDVVNYTRSRFTARITSSTTYKAKKIALAIVEGDAVKQYAI